MNAVADLRRVAVFGATGSIGASTLDVIARHPQRYQATVLAAGRQVQALLVPNAPAPKSSRSTANTARSSSACARATPALTAPVCAGSC